MISMLQTVPAQSMYALVWGGQNGKLLVIEYRPLRQGREKYRSSQRYKLAQVNGGGG
ncbi:hypothetical protein [Thermogutta sp.]|uniref:hypothetical protein n=1 Tax=Thermogutta sp. TaxID=1962930 RepID=UPI0032209507